MKNTSIIGKEVITDKKIGNKYHCMVDVDMEAMCYLWEKHDYCDVEKALQVLPLDTSYSFGQIILLNDSQLVNIEEIAAAIGKRADVSICYQIHENDIEKLVELKQRGVIHNISVTPDLIPYLISLGTRGITQFIIGSEKWIKYSFANFPYGLFHMGRNENTIENIGSSLKLAENVATEILGQNPQNELETVLLVDAWIQRNIQFIKNRETEMEIEGKTYVCEDCKKEALLNDVLENHYGVCEDISFSVALILSDPRIGIKCRTVSNINHTWNIVEVEGTEYFFDATRNITRGEGRLPYALKATRYTTNRTLFGYDDYPTEYATINSRFDNTKLSHKSFDRNRLSKAVETMKHDGRLIDNWGNHLIMNSRVK